MPSIQYTTKYKKNTGLLLSARELRVQYFYGINIEATDGTAYSDEVFEMHIRQAQEEVEKYFGIKLIEQLREEKQSYYRDDYFENGFPIVPTDYPVVQPLSMIGLLNKTEQVVFPELWLSSRSKNNDTTYARRISVIPTGSTSSGSADIILSGVTFQTGIYRWNMIPDYYTIQYKTGFEKIEWDLYNLIGMMASIPSLIQAGDLILGSAGIASQSLSIDGLSTSLSTTSSATNSGYGARIQEYRKSIKATVDRLATRYKTLRFTTL